MRRPNPRNSHRGKMENLEVALNPPIKPDPKNPWPPPKMLFRFWKKVSILENGCWQWNGATAGRGYGMFWWKDNGRCGNGLSHMFSYLAFRGEYDRSLKLDHDCENKLCVNPMHLTPVTNRFNILRSNAVSARNFVKTHCIRGHEFSYENTIRLRGSRSGRPYRLCKECLRKRSQEFRDRRKLSKLAKV